MRLLEVCVGLEKGVLCLLTHGQTGSETMVMEKLVILIIYGLTFDTGRVTLYHSSLL